MTQVLLECCITCVLKDRELEGKASLGGGSTVSLVLCGHPGPVLTGQGQDRCRATPASPQLPAGARNGALAHRHPGVSRQVELEHPHAHAGAPGRHQEPEAHHAWWVGGRSVGAGQSEVLTRTEGDGPLATSQR